MDILLYLQELRNPVLDVICKIASLCGEDVLIVAILCFVLWCVNKKEAYKLGYAFSTALGINQILKLTFCIERPWVINPKIKPSPLATETATGYSFPSGHTQTSSVLFLSGAYAFTKKWIKIILSLLPLLVAFSRMYFGVHTLLDVSVSLIIGIALTTFLHYKGDIIYTEKFKIAMGIFIVIYGVFIIIRGEMAQSQNIDTKLICDGFKSLGAMLGFFIGINVESKYIKFTTNINAIRKIVRFVIGLSVTMALKVLFKYIISNYFMYFLSYFILIIWVMLIYPLIFTKVGRNKGK